MAYMDFFKNLPVEIFTRQEITNVCVENGRIVSVESSTHRFEGEVFIDSTGDGDVAALAGCPFRYGREAASEFNELFAPQEADRVVQSCTLMFTVKRMPETAVSKIEPIMAQFDDDEALIWGPTVECNDTCDPAEVSKAQEKALSMMPYEVEKWRKMGFYISSIAPKLGVRESRRIEGLYMLNHGDMKGRRTYHDSVCVVEYGIDPWEPEGNPMHDPDRSEPTAIPPYEIPYRCLVNVTIDNLIVAGRCISATHVANSSLRVMGICIPLGQAAGNAAYLTVRDKCAARDVKVGELRQMQVKGGVKVSL